jgi:hypothetical protein
MARRRGFPTGARERTVHRSGNLVPLLGAEVSRQDRIVFLLFGHIKGGPSTASISRVMIITHLEASSVRARARMRIRAPRPGVFARPPTMGGR